MSLPPDLEAAVRERLQEYLAGTWPDPLSLRAIVARFGALPLITDWGGCYALRLDGEIVTYEWEEPHRLAVLGDERLRRAALFQGSRKYPELARLVPARPSAATDCRSCGGTGVVVVDGQTLPGIICACGGLGWVPVGP